MPLNHTSRFAQLTDRQFELLGRAVVEWANIEHLLGCILVRLLLTPDFPGRTVTDRMRAAQVEESIKEAIEVHRVRYDNKLLSSDTQVKIESILSTVSGMRGLRNKLAHFCWSRNTDDEIFGTSFSAGLPGTKKHERSYVSLSTADLEDAHQSFARVVDELSQVLELVREVDEEQAKRQYSQSGA